MRAFLYKFLFVTAFACLIAATPSHPIFVSVVEIEHNAKSNSLEISCKIFTDDFEKALRKTYNTHIDLLDANNKVPMQKYINDYVQKHFKVAVNAQTIPLRFVGFEQEEEGVICYFEAGSVSNVRTVAITDNILYEFQSQQMGLVHCTVNGTTQHYKLNNPEEKVEFRF